MEVLAAIRRHRWWKLGLFATVITVMGAVGVFVASAEPVPEGKIVGADRANAIPNSYVVVLKRGASADVAGKTRSVASAFNLQVRRTYSAAAQGFSVTMTAAQARRVAGHPAVAFVEQNQTIRVDATQTNPPSWGLDRIDQRPLPLDHAYTYTTTASNVHAYVIDTGIRLSHNDFGGRAATGVDEITPGGTADDCNGHGTHVAATVGGSTYGVAKGVSLVAVRVLDCAGSGSTETVLAGVDWVTANAVKPAVANMSLGSSPDPALDSAVSNSIASGVSYTVSAGNRNADACGQSPARVAAAITVGATDINDNRASFSNFGSCLDVFAPGVGITSASNASDTATRVLSGTSMAAPHVTGAAALVLADNPTFSPAQVQASLIGNATPSSVVNRGSGSPNQLLYTGSTPTPPPVADDFDLRANTDPVLMVPGGSASSGIQIPITAGNAQTVSLSAIGLPTGVSASFSPPSLSTGLTSTATFDASNSTAPGHYSVAIAVAGAAVTHLLSLTVIVSSNVGTYYPLTPARILDTRIGLGAPTAPLGQGSTISLQVTGRGGVPASGVGAVVLNVTSTGATAPSFVTVYPNGVSRPLASSLNIVPGWTGANSVTVAVGTGGKVNIYNNSGSTHMIADVVGFYADGTTVVPQFGIGGEYQPVIPGRLFDSRTDLGEKIPAGSFEQVGVDFGPDVNQHIRALVVNVTAVSPESDGYVATWNGNGPLPGTSTLNYKRGDGAVPNMAVVPAGQCCGGFPAIGVYTHATSHIIVDLMGFVDDSTLGGLRFTPQTPVRIADTRLGSPIPALGQQVTGTITAPGTVAPAGTEGLAINLTAVAPSTWTFLSVWPAGIPGVSKPLVSNLNPNPGQVIPNSVYTLVGPTMAFNVYNNAGTTNVVVDVVGTFWDPEATPGMTSTTGKHPALSGKQPLRPIGSRWVKIEPS
jgi:subtilisin family serine protease